MSTRSRTILFLTATLNWFLFHLDRSSNHHFASESFMDKVLKLVRGNTTTFWIVGFEIVKRVIWRALPRYDGTPCQNSCAASTRHGGAGLMNRYMLLVNVRMRLNKPVPAKSAWRRSATTKFISSFWFRR